MNPAMSDCALPRRNAVPANQFRRVTCQPNRFVLYGQVPWLSQRMGSWYLIDARGGLLVACQWVKMSILDLETRNDILGTSPWIFRGNTLGAGRMVGDRSDRCCAQAWSVVQEPHFRRTTFIVIMRPTLQRNGRRRARSPWSFAVEESR